MKKCILILFISITGNIFSQETDKSQRGGKPLKTENIKKTNILKENDTIIETNQDENEYMIEDINLYEGFKLYNKFCTNCHTNQGEGIDKISPSLVKSKYLMNENGLQDLICILKKGQLAFTKNKRLLFHKGMQAFQSTIKNEDLYNLVYFITKKFGNQDLEIRDHFIKNQCLKTSTLD